MQSLARGWSFMQQAWQMAFKDKDLIKPSIYALIVGFFVSIIGIIPLIGASFLFGGSNSFVGQIAMVVVGAILIFAHYVVSYILWHILLQCYGQHHHMAETSRGLTLNQDGNQPLQV